MLHDQEVSDLLLASSDLFGGGFVGFDFVDIFYGNEIINKLLDRIFMEFNSQTEENL